MIDDVMHYDKLVYHMTQLTAVCHARDLGVVQVIWEDKRQHRDFVSSDTGFHVLDWHLGKYFFVGLES